VKPGAEDAWNYSVQDAGGAAVIYYSQTSSQRLGGFPHSGTRFGGKARAIGC